MRMNTLTMSREAVSPSPRRTEAKTDRKRSKGPEIRRTGNPPQVTLKQIRCQFVYGIENQPRMTRITPDGKIGVRLVNSLFPITDSLTGKREFTSLTPIFPPHFGYVPTFPGGSKTSGSIS